MEALGIHILDDPRDQDCKYVISHWLRTDVRLCKLEFPKEIIPLIDSYFYAGDEWNAWGKCLRIVNDYYSNSKIENIGSVTTDASGFAHRGSAYGLRVICPPSTNDAVSGGQYYWKLRVGAENEYTFGIGCVKEENAVIDANGWYIRHEHSVGIYSDSQVWTKGTLLANDGIEFTEHDLINLCVDYTTNGVYVQRLEYLCNVYNEYKPIGDDQEQEEQEHGKKDPHHFAIITDTEIPKHFIVHKAKRVFNGIAADSNYRLAVYLRNELQSVEIIKFATQPFAEWDVDPYNANDETNIDKPVIFMYQ